jgi:peroxiredoxin Q/BCP
LSFIDKYDLNFALLSDPSGSACSQYGACGKNGGGGVARMTIIIDEEGKIEKIYPKVRPLGHAMKVLSNI